MPNKPKKHRKEKVSILLHEQITTLLRLHAKNPILRMLIITKVDISADLRLAKVYYRCNETNIYEVIQSSLEKAKSFLRRQIAKDLNLRFTPDLEFHNDNSLEMGAHIENLLSEP